MGFQSHCSNFDEILAKVSIIPAICYPLWFFVRSAGTWSLALLTCAALLQLPVPILHRHADYDFADSLAGHLDTCHAETRFLRDSTQGVDELHWHFVLPRELGREHDSEENAPAAQASGLCLVGSSSMGVSVGSSAAHPFDQPPHDASAATLSTKVAAHLSFQKTQPCVGFRPAVRVCALLCVLRC